MEWRIIKHRNRKFYGWKEQLYDFEILSVFMMFIKCHWRLQAYIHVLPTKIHIIILELHVYNFNIKPSPEK